MKHPKPDRPPPSRLAAALFSVPFLLAGGAIIGIGAGWIGSDPSKVHAPTWVLVTCGLMFLTAGLAMLNSAIRPGKKPSALFGIVILVGLTAVCNWVAFGPGERNFSSRTSVSGRVVDERPVRESSGRIVFGAAAVVLDLIVVWSAVVVVRRRRRPHLTPETLSGSG